MGTDHERNNSDQKKPPLQDRDDLAKKQPGDEEVSPPGGQSEDQPEQRE